MPRAYTEQEQAHIRSRLLDVGEERFTALGLSKVTVGELTEAVGIGKGSFYLFFDSKEALFFAVQERVEASFKAMFAAELEPLEGDPRALLERYFGLQLELMEVHPFLHRLTHRPTMEALMRKLPPAVLADHRAQDRAYFTGLVRRWIERDVLPPGTDPELVFSLSAAMFALSMSRDVIGDGYASVKAALPAALARQLLDPEG